MSAKPGRKTKTKLTTGKPKNGISPHQHDSSPTSESPPWDTSVDQRGTKVPWHLDDAAVDGLMRTIGSTEARTVMSGKSSRKPRTQLEEDVAICLSALLAGRVLAIDPSSGSENSQPGYALYEAGVLIDSGYISIGKNDRISGRLYRLGRSLREDFQVPDVVVTENIPPFMGAGAGGFSSRAVIHLHQSIGVVVSIWDVPTVRVTPRTWQSMTPPAYSKTDEADAIMLGWAALQTARRMSGEEQAVMPERMKHKLETGEWQ